jgi:prepilin-type N-terminal cleavage/methylation domain-containing protein
MIKKLSQAFTMIELLIVISVLGILAVGLLAAVDPFEQLKKSRDTNTRQSVLALQTALTRYYATHNGLPWDTSSNVDCYTTYGDAGIRPDATMIADAGMAPCIASVEADGELKPGFVNALGANAQRMYISSANVSDISVCFAPESKSVFAEENTKYSNDGTLADGTGGAVDCTTASGKEAAGIGACYYCAR